MYVGHRVKYLFFFSDSTETWIFWTDFHTNFMKIRPLGAELLHVVAFRNFENAPKNIRYYEEYRIRCMGKKEPS